MIPFRSKKFDSLLNLWLLQKVSSENRAELLSRLLCDPNFREQLSEFVKTLRSPWIMEQEDDSKNPTKKRAA
jgi:hypothetical protein